MRKNVFIYLVVFISFVKGCSSGETISPDEAVGNYSRIVPELLKYNFVFDTFPEGELPFLMGNSEMGGLISPTGTGFPFMWFADVWKHESARTSLLGFTLSNRMVEKSKPSVYYQELDISNGILNTVFVKQDLGYESEVFLSMDDRHLMAMKITNTGSSSIHWDITVPDRSDGFNVEKNGRHEIYGLTEDSLFEQSFWNIENHRAVAPDSFLTHVKWRLKTDKEIMENGGSFFVNLGPSETAVFYYKVVTSWDEEDFRGYDVSIGYQVPDYDLLRQKNIDEWQRLYDNTAAIILPEGDYAKLYYRTVYSLFATSGSEHFLPGETQFGALWRDIGHLADRSFSNCLWDMNAFTYGAAGWAAMAFTTLGNEERARNMLSWFYQPESLKKNVRTMFPVGNYTLHFRGDTVGTFHYMKGENPDAMAFGHETKINMENFNWFGDGSHVDWQLHYNAFASSIFHKFSGFFPDEEFVQDTTYPLLKGLAEFWKELLNWNGDVGGYVLPGLVSLTEDLVAENPTDAAISARWNLLMAAEYAEKLGKDEVLREGWRSLADQVYIPQNEEYYLEFLNDDGARKGGGYQGIRGMVYLTYPTSELISALDHDKIVRTLDHTWERNYAGRSRRDIGQLDLLKKPELDLEQLSGMITFIANWFAIAEAYAGRGDNAYDVSSYCLTKLDKGNNVLFETDNLRPYYLDSYASFAIVPPSMLVQSNSNTIKVFPAMPGTWRDVSFYDLPAAHGIKVSGRMGRGEVEWIRFFKDGKVIATSNERGDFEIVVKRNRISVKKL